MKRSVVPAPIRLVDEAQPAALPQFSFATSLGRGSIEDVTTDIVLIPMLYGMSVPQSLHADDQGVGAVIRTAIHDHGFEGKRGTSLPVETELLDSQGGNNRVVLLAGLGRPQCFDADVAESVFGKLIEEAVTRGSTTILIPFIANRMTKTCLNLKGTAHRLKRAVVHAFAKLDGPVALKEIKIYCSPQAKAHIEKGLNAPVDDPSFVDDCCTA